MCKMRNMSEVDEIQWIRDDLKQPGKSQAGLARHMGWDPSVVSKILRGRRGLKVQEAAKIRAYFGAKIESKAISKNEIQSLSLQPLGERNLPILGAAKGGERGLFLDNGAFFEMVQRPPTLADVTEAYAVYMVGDSMEPRYFPGEILYVHPHKPPRRGDFVIVQLEPADQAGEPEYLVKQFQRRNEKELVLHQFNPEKDTAFPSARIRAIHKIVLGGEGA